MIFGSIRTIHTLGIPTAIASRSLSPGCGRTNNLDVTVHRSPSTIDTSTIPPTPTVIVSEPMTHSPAPQTAEEGIRKEPGQDGKDAVYEFSCSEKRLSAQPILFVVRSNSSTRSRLYFASLWMSSLQASRSVSSGRILSSSKETCTRRCSNLSLTTLEALQVLKFVYKFIADLVAIERARLHNMWIYDSKSS